MRHWRWLHLSLLILVGAACGSASRIAPHDPWPAEREGDDGAGQQPMGYAGGSWSDHEPSKDEGASDHDEDFIDQDDGSESDDVGSEEDLDGGGGDDFGSDDDLGGDDLGGEDDEGDLEIDIGDDAQGARADEAW